MFKIVIFMSMALTQFLIAYAPENKFKGYYDTKVFIETGTFHGESVYLALKAGFSKIYSIELNPKFARECQIKFKNKKNVSVISGDSKTVLAEITKNLDERALFWLDAHYSGGDTSKGNQYSPIVDELKIIGSHHIKNHTILIDDVRLFGTEEMDFVKIDEIIYLIKSINPDYQIQMINCGFKNDVLEARIF